jgi:F-box interacting protein
MAGAAGALSGSAPSAARILPEEVVVWEILVRLPARELLRCRAACQSWRRRTSAVDFLLAHHQHQPSLPLVAFSAKDCNEQGYFDKVVDAFDHRLVPAERRRPVLGFRDRRDGRVVLHASCHGLILLSVSTRRFQISNPATGQWASLPALVGAHVAGMYPSGEEYRILYWKQRFKGDSPVYHVLTVGSSEEPRCIGLPIASAPLNQLFLEGMNPSSSHPPVLLHSCLHSLQGRKRSSMVVFDTVGESFRPMRSPFFDDDWDPYLHEIDGTLRISCLNSVVLKIWVLLDYDKEVWSLRYHVKVPRVGRLYGSFDSSSSYTVVSEKGDMLLFLFNRMFHCDSEGKGLGEFKWESCDPCNAKHLFKESLIRHVFFPRRGSWETPYFLLGLLGTVLILGNLVSLLM